MRLCSIEIGPTTRPDLKIYAVADEFEVGAGLLQATESQNAKNTKSIESVSGEWTWAEDVVEGDIAPAFWRRKRIRGVIAEGDPKKLRRTLLPLAGKRKGVLTRVGVV